MPRWGLVLIGLALLVGAGFAFAASRGSDQPEVGADVLPVVALAHRADVYGDCSKVNGVAYFSENPCQTFVLIESDHFGSALEFWEAETRVLRMAGWRHSAPQLVDYDGSNDGMARRNESWVLRAQRACAYVATDRMGVVAERPSLFPYDPYDIPHGLYVFYRRAKAVTRGQTLWVRLRPQIREVAASDDHVHRAASRLAWSPA